MKRHAGARTSVRFNVRGAETLEQSARVDGCTLKRRERRTPRQGDGLRAGTARAPGCALLRGFGDATAMGVHAHDRKNAIPGRQVIWRVEIARAGQMDGHLLLN